MAGIIPRFCPKFAAQVRRNKGLRYYVVIDSESEDNRIWQIDAMVPDTPVGVAGMPLDLIDLCTKLCDLFQMTDVHFNRNSNFEKPWKYADRVPCDR